MSKIEISGSLGDGTFHPEPFTQNNIISSCFQGELELGIAIATKVMAIALNYYNNSSLDAKQNVKCYLCW